LDKVVTLRDCDWENLKEYFFIPNKPEEIDHTPIILKSKVQVSIPLKNNYLSETTADTFQGKLFEPNPNYSKP
jgi:site-specific DNA-methyltransferase (adenine-specific)